MLRGDKYLLKVKQPSLLNRQINEGLPMLQELRGLQAKKRLTAKAFAEHARVTASISAGRVKKLAARTEQRTGTMNIRQFIANASKEFSTDRWPSPPLFEKTDRIIRVYGNAEAIAGELAALEVTGPELVCIAACRAAERFPDRFGEIENMTAHRIQIANLEDALRRLYEGMRRGWGAGDIVLTRAANELQQISFRAAPDLSPDQIDWPSRLLTRVYEDRLRRGVLKPIIKRRRIRRKREVEDAASASAAVLPTPKAEPAPKSVVMS